MTFNSTGCQNTPSKGSRYCGNHNKTAMVFRDDGVEDEILHAEEKDDTNKPGSLIVKVINELTTRQGIRYEVKTMMNKTVLQTYNVHF